MYDDLDLHTLHYKRTPKSNWAKASISMYMPLYNPTSQALATQAALENQENWYTSQWLPQEN